MTEEPLVAGVIGGLGPEASLDFYARVLRRTPARGDQDHLHLIINSNPRVPNRNEAIAGTGPLPGPYLADMALALERAGADFLVMACNTAHAWLPDIKRATSLPFISIIDETVNATLNTVPGARRVGLLATSGCLDAGLYQTAFSEQGLTTLEVDRERFMALLYRIKSGDTGPEARQEMQQLAGALGADVVVAACTEVPLVLDPADLNVPLISSTDVLVEATIAAALGKRPLLSRD